MPTLLVGDFILVQKFTYGIKNPITNNILINVNKPKYGDVIVFKHPKNSNLNYIKRVIGLPGDKITYNFFTKNLIIQFNTFKKNYNKKQTFIPHINTKQSDFFQLFKYDIEPMFLNNSYDYNKKIEKNVNLNICTEKLGQSKYKILFSKEIIDNNDIYFKQPNQEKGTWIVPKDMYFVMGDNRDNSLDSRYWGFVPKKNLIGKAIFIWMSFKKTENSWPTSIRINRIGSIH